MDLGLADRVYLVTGGSRGLGYAAAEALVAEGARVVVSGRDAGAAAGAAQALGAGQAVGLAADNADPATPGRLIATARGQFGRLDSALISVGGPPPGPATDVPGRHPAAAGRRAGRVRPGRRVHAVPCGQLPDRDDAPGRRRRAPGQLSGAAAA